jgi:hypothetical protein
MRTNANDLMNLGWRSIFYANERNDPHLLGKRETPGPSYLARSRGFPGNRSHAYNMSGWPNNDMLRTRN